MPWPARLALVAFLASAAPGHAQTLPLPAQLPALPAAQQAHMDRDLLEIDIPRLHALYARHRYSVAEVTRWYLGRIARYNGIYRAVQTVDAEGALAIAAREDAQPPKARHGALWGVPIVIKANTAVQGLPDTDGWQGFALPGHAFVAAKDATVVAKLRAAGAVILGITNMPDFAASDTNRSSAFGRTGNAYDVRYSPGGSSGGTVTAVTANMALLGTGTDTANSIRMPAGTSALVGLMPTRGLVSIAGIAPLDWLRDNTGPIARNVADAAVALDAMAGEDPLDARTQGAATRAQPGPYTAYLKQDALRGKRFGVPAFILDTRADEGSGDKPARYVTLRPQTRAMLMAAIAQLRAAGATVVIDDTLLPRAFLDAAAKVDTRPYRLDGTDRWLAAFGPADYRSAAEYAEHVGAPLPMTLTGTRTAADPVPEGRPAPPSVPQRRLADDPDAQARYYAPQRAALAEYEAALDRLHLDGLIYPSAQMPPPDETMPQDGRLSGGPHSETGWANRLGVPAIVVPAGFYPGGLPFGLEIAARPWRDGDLLGWAYAYEQATHARRPPVLVERGLLPGAP
ncbi:amidase [Frateuria defendens]|uniref:amidase n=1 Tax=Frateuria defendens TaxID=2219559 RepID=UPI000AD4B400|nr:amidase [Frateuria defendens]